MAAASISSKKIKFLYGYGGKIMACGNGANCKLRYIGGTNKILVVDRCITYTELIVKLWDTCGPSMNLRCKLPMNGFDKLVHVTCDKDLANVIEKYDRVGSNLRIRAILDPIQPSITKVVHAQAPVLPLPVVVPRPRPPPFYHAWQIGVGDGQFLGLEYQGHLAQRYQGVLEAVIQPNRCGFKSRG